MVSRHALAPIGALAYRGHGLVAVDGGCMLRTMLITLGTVLLTACAQTNATGSSQPLETAASVPTPVSRPQEMLNRLVGRWLLTGTIAGQSTVHDVEADWALQRNYVRIGEVSQERGDNGQP